MGEIVYEDLRDRLYGAPGKWTLRRCSSDQCGLLWLDSMPAAEELGKLYRNYYTHVAAAQKPVPLSAKVTERLRDAYCAGRYGYPGPQGRSAFVLRHLAHLLPGHRAQWDFSVFHLPAQPQGRLLEIGCGSGTMLKRMAQLGWQVEGIDFDPKAVEIARSQGLKVHLGSVGELDFAAGSFDAVVMSHVLEHVPDPRALLQACKHLLKPRGRLVSITPNASSWGHSLYGRNWRGLEPPRHLHIFTSEAMEHLAKDIGFHQVELTSSIANAHWVLWSSKQLKEHDELVQANYTVHGRLWARAMQVAEWIRLKSSADAGEEIVFKAMKGSEC